MLSSAILLSVIVINLARITYCDDNIPKSLSDATADFSLAILKNSGPSTQNVFFSPASISTCVGMVYSGSGGETENQINKVIFGGLSESKVYTDIKTSVDEFSNLPSGYSLDVANRIYTDNIGKLSPVAKLKLSENFKSDIINVNFGDSEPTRQTINNWVKEKTRDKIEELLPSGSIGSDTKMVLVNAIYFKGTWQETFNQSKTRQKPFFSTASQQFNVQMMQTQHDKIHFFEDSNTKVLGIPFKDETVMMYFILPTERFGLSRLEQKLNGKDMLDLFNKTVKRRNVLVNIPKFKLKKDLPLKQVLIDLNVTDMFTPNKANLTGFYLPGGPKVYISKAFHKAAIEVNEEGSEAAAATGMIASVRSSTPTPSFTADQPFLFAIVHRNTKAILFFGRFFDDNYANAADGMTVENVRDEYDVEFGLLYDKLDIVIKCTCSTYKNISILDPSGNYLEIMKYTDSVETTLQVNEKLALGRYKCLSDDVQNFSHSLDILYRLCPANKRNCQNDLNATLCVITTNGSCSSLTSDMCRMHDKPNLYACNPDKQSDEQRALCDAIAENLFGKDKPAIVESFVPLKCTKLQTDYTTFRIVNDANADCDSLNDTTAPLAAIGDDYFLQTNKSSITICYHCITEYDVKVRMYAKSINLNSSEDLPPCRSSKGNDKRNERIDTLDLHRRENYGSTVVQFIVESMEEGRKDFVTRNYVFLVLIDASTKIETTDECSAVKCSFLGPVTDAFVTNFSWLFEGKHINAEETAHDYSIVKFQGAGKYECLTTVVYYRIYVKGTFTDSKNSSRDLPENPCDEEGETSIYLHIAVALGAILITIIVVIVAYVFISRRQDSSPVTSTTSTFSSDPLTEAKKSPTQRKKLPRKKRNESTKS